MLVACYTTKVQQATLYGSRVELQCNKAGLKHSFDMLPILTPADAASLQNKR